ncbi:MAG: glycosyltransferase [Patescibacteria group bacterium]
MEVLMITQDMNVLREGSVEQSMLKEYAQDVRRLVVLVLNTHGDHYKPQKISDSLWIIPCNSWFKIMCPFSALSIARRELFFQGRMQTDVCTGQDTGLAGFSAWIIALSFKRPLHLHVQENLFSPVFIRGSFYNWIRYRIARFLLLSADGVRATSEGIRAALADFDTPLADRVVVTPDLIDTHAIQDEPLRVDLRAKYPQFTFIILVVAPLTKSQNVQTAVNIFAKIHHAYPHVGLVIVGEGPQHKHIIRLTHDLNIAESVVFEKPNNNMTSYYKTAQVLLVTALYEVDSKVITGAAAASCMIASSKVGIVTEIFEHDVSAFLCDPEDIQTYVQPILKSIHIPGLREKIRLNGMLAIMNRSDTNKSAYIKTYCDSWQKAIDLGK